MRFCLVAGVVDVHIVSTYHCEGSRVFFLESLFWWVVIELDSVGKQKVEHDGRESRLMDGLCNVIIQGQSEVRMAKGEGGGDKRERE